MTFATPPLTHTYIEFIEAVFNPFTIMHPICLAHLSKSPSIIPYATDELSAATGKESDGECGALPTTLLHLPLYQRSPECCRVTHSLLRCDKSLVVRPTLPSEHQAAMPASRRGRCRPSHRRQWLRDSRAASAGCEIDRSRP